MLAPRHRQSYPNFPSYEKGSRFRRWHFADMAPPSAISAFGARTDIQPMGSDFRFLTLNGHHRRGYRTDRDFMAIP
jgi:hypothetical protein